MGNSNKSIKSQPETPHIVQVETPPKFLNENLNFEKKRFRHFIYDKTYFDQTKTDQFLEYIERDCLPFRSKLDAITLDNISEALLSFPNLKGLKLPLKNQELGNIQKINTVLLKIQTLMVLDLNLEFSLLTDNDLCKFIGSFKNMSNLVDLKLNLSFTKFSNKSMESLCNILSKIKNLNELSLDLEVIPLHSSEFSPLLSQIKLLKNLCYLCLRINESDIGDEGLILLADSLKNLENLSGLELRMNKNITSQGLNYLFDVLISKQDQMITLKLFFNLNQITNIFKMTEVVKSQKYLLELLWDFVGSVKMDQDYNEILNVDAIGNLLENSLYLFNFVALPSLPYGFHKLRIKAKIIPILQIVTSNLRRRKYRKEIIEEIVEMLIPKIK